MMKSLLISLFLLMWALPAFAVDYYISSSTGDDDNDGLTEQTAWQNLDQIYLTFYYNPLGPGDRLLLKRGDVWDGSVWQLRAEGNASDPAIMGAYGSGDNPIITSDGSLLQWSPMPCVTDVYRAYLGQRSIIKKVTEDGTTLSRVGGTNDPDITVILDQLTPGSFAASYGHDFIYMMATDQQSPATHETLVLRTGVEVRANHIIIEDIDFVGTWHAIVMRDSTGLVVRNVNVRGTESNAIYAIANVSDSTVENVEVRNSKGPGLYALNSSDIIFRNSRLFDITGESSIGLQTSTNIVVEGNEVWRGKSGVDYYFDEGSIVRNNWLYGVGICATPHGTDMQFYGNVCNLDGQPSAYGNRRYGISAANLGSSVLDIYDNIFFGAETYGLYAGETVIGAPVPGPITYRNNIVVMLDGGRAVNVWGHVTLDDNIYFSEGAMIWKWEGVDHSTFSNYQADSGEDQNSVVADPGFISLFPLIREDFYVE